MPEELSETTILISFDASGPGDVSSALVDLIGPHRVVILGYYPVPDQATAGQLRDEFGEEATAVVQEIVERFETGGATVESTVVFTRDPDQTVESTVNEYDADAVLTAGDIGETLDSVLVPLRGDATVGPIVEFVAALLRGSDADVTLFHVPESEADAETGEFLLRGVRDRLIDEGLDDDRVDWHQKEAVSPMRGIVDVAAGYDLLIVGESEPSLREKIFGTVTNEVVEKSGCPALVVRN